MTVLGITGGIGMGKSVTADMLRRRGVPLVDTDILAREVVERGEPAYLEVVRQFGADVLQDDGQLDRKALGAVVFQSPEQRRLLESILHPVIRERWMSQVEEWRTREVGVGAVVIPLLFETGAEAECDQVICLVCSRETQQGRLLARGWSREEIDRRIAAQWPIEKKMRLADYVVWSEPNLEMHARQLDCVLQSVGFDGAGSCFTRSL